MILSVLFMLVAVAIGANLAFSRPARFVLFMLPASVFSFGAETDGMAGLANLSAIWLLCLLILCGVAIFRLGGPRIPLSLAEVAYLLFLGWCVVESFRATELPYAARTFLRLLFPFLSMYLARRSITSPETAERLVRFQFRTTLVSAFVFWGMFFAPAISVYFVQLVWYGAVFFDHAAIIAILALADWKLQRRRVSGLIALLLISICFISVNRTAMMALLAGGGLFCAISYRKLAIVLLPALLVGGTAVLLFVPSFRDKMFYAPERVDSSNLAASVTANAGQINNNGRFAMWDTVLKRFFWPNPLAGAGLGSTQAWFYSGAAKEAGCGDLKVEHSEYVRLMSDVGIVGLGAFVAALLASALAAVRAYRRSTGVTARVVALAAICAAPIFLVCMAFDNALLYVLPVAQFPFALAAIASRMSGERVLQPRHEPSAVSTGPRPMPRRALGERFADNAGVMAAPTV